MVKVQTGADPSEPLKLWPSFVMQACSRTDTHYIKSAADDTRAAMAKLERFVIGNQGEWQ